MSTSFARDWRFATYEHRDAALAIVRSFVTDGRLLGIPEERPTVPDELRRRCYGEERERQEQARRDLWLRHWGACSARALTVNERTAAWSWVAETEHTGHGPGYYRDADSRSVARCVGYLLTCAG